MYVARTILAFLIAASVALLPMAGGVSAAPSRDMSTAMNMPSMDMSQTDDMSIAMNMSDCCPHDAVPCDKANADCASMLACSGVVLNLPAPGFSNLIFPMVLAEVGPMLAGQILHSQTSATPFRPPRV